MLKIKQIITSVFAIAILLVLFAGCSDKNDGEDGKVSAAWLVAETVNCETTTNKIETQGSAKLTYVAEITAQGDVDWCSFDLKNQQSEITGEVGTPIYLYLKQNTTENDRTAKIAVTFSDNYTTTLTLTQTAFSVTADYDKAWGEQPEYRENSDYTYKTYYTTLANGYNVRNYSICYDRNRHVSNWVAYPNIKDYWSSHAYQAHNSNGRTDAWAYDDWTTQYMSSYPYYEQIGTNVQPPAIAESDQQYIIRGYGASGYDRGHMLPSASRYSTWTTNAQTFFATNMMPQNSTLNQKIWATLEGKIRGWECWDTLFVVKGTCFKNTKTINNQNGPIAVPSHCWAIVLRTRNGNLKKKISDCTADELKAIGFVFTNDAAGAATSIKDAARSVQEIEELSEFKFFRNLSPDAAEAVKSQNNPADWSL